jgi:hypothetical protein
MSQKIFWSIFLIIKHEKTFKIPSFCFKVSGFEGQSKYLRLVQWFLIASNAYAGFSELFFAVKNRGSMLEAADAFGSFVTAVLVEPKALTFVFKRKKFDELKEKIRNLNDEGL